MQRIWGASHATLWVSTNSRPGYCSTKRKNKKTASGSGHVYHVDVWLLSCLRGMPWSSKGKIICFPSMHPKVCQRRKFNINS
eukprot:21153_4